MRWTTLGRAIRRTVARAADVEVAAEGATATEVRTTTDPGAPCRRLRRPDGAATGPAVIETMLIAEALRLRN